MKKVLNVTQLNNYIKQTLFLDPILKKIYVEGNIVSLTYHKNGYLYLTVGDGTSTLQAIHYHPNQENQLREEQYIQIRGHINFYVQRGNCQLIIDEILLSKEELENVKKKRYEKLLAMGVFEKQKKLKLPKYPQKIIVLTSDTGAVIHDIHVNAKRRWPLTEIVLFPTRMQGSLATSEIIENIRRISNQQLQNIQEVDAILLARGGGGKEEFEIFDGEDMIYSIADCPVPIITALGHEINRSLADFAAYHSVSTPTEAMEFLLPDKKVEQHYLKNLYENTNIMVSQKMDGERNRLQKINLQYINQLLQLQIREKMNCLDELTQEFGETFFTRIQTEQKKLQEIRVALGKLDPLEPLKRNFVYLLKESKIININALNIGDSVDIVGEHKTFRVLVKEEKNGQHDI